MIKNERQHRITMAQIARFDQALERYAGPLSPNSAKLDPRLREAQQDALTSQRDELRDEIANYLRTDRLAARAFVAEIQGTQFIRGVEPASALLEPRHPLTSALA